MDNIGHNINVSVYAAASDNDKIKIYSVGIRLIEPAISGNTNRINTSNQMASSSNHA